jgi:hypothetical protein
MVSLLARLRCKQLEPLLQTASLESSTAQHNVVQKSQVVQNAVVNTKLMQRVCLPELPTALTPAHHYMSQLARRT